MNSLEKYAAKHRLISRLIEKLAEYPSVRHMRFPPQTVYGKLPEAAPQGDVQLVTTPQPGYRKGPRAVVARGQYPGTATTRTAPAQPVDDAPVLSEADVRPGYRPDLSYLPTREDQRAKANRLLNQFLQRPAPTAATR